MGAIVRAAVTALADEGNSVVERVRSIVTVALVDTIVCLHG